MKQLMKQLIRFSSVQYEPLPAKTDCCSTCRHTYSKQLQLASLLGAGDASFR
jgi:hypothetical protein